VDGSQGGYPPPAGGQWPGDGSGGTGGPGGSGGSPYGGHDPYSDPTYGGQGSYGNAYGTPPPQSGGYPYGQPPAYGQPPSYEQQPPYGQTAPYGPGGEPPKKSRAGLVTGLAIGAAVVLIGGTAAVIGMNSGGDEKPTAASSPLTSGAPTSPAASPSVVDAGGHHSLTVPESVGPYHRMTGSVADRLAATMRKSMNQDQSGKYADVYAKSKIAIYSKNGDAAHPLIFVGLSADDSPSIAEELRTRTPSEEVDSTFLGMGLGDAKDFPPGPLGGVLRCGTGPMSGSTAAACAWADSSTVGAVITPSSSSAATVAGTTLDLRNAAEH
jgi:hypothetical protein